MSDFKLQSFDNVILQNMRDPEYAIAYLQDALDDSVEDFLLALNKCVKANGGIAKCAEQAGISREALYRMLSESDLSPRAAPRPKWTRFVGGGEIGACGCALAQQLPSAGLHGDQGA